MDRRRTRVGWVHTTKAARYVFALVWALYGLVIAASAHGADATAAAARPDPDIAALSRLFSRASDAVVGLHVEALEDARSSAMLGRERFGSGVLIDPDGLVLTIGYLILEADQIQIVLDEDRVVPARAVAYDVATGFGLVRSLAPVRREPVPLGRSALLSQGDPLVIASGGPDAEVSNARLMVRKAFAGYWEYQIDNALFTAPPRTDHSGAGLFNDRGELVGIGSLLVADTMSHSEGPVVPGNMFVPVDLLTPILNELQRAGSSAASHRAWLGVNCVELAGQLRVVRVSVDSPADVGGLEPGDRIVRIDGIEVATLDALWTSLWAGGQAERDVVLDIRRGDEARSVTLHSVDRMKTLKRATGI